jgi:hypothetical protein
MAGKAILMTRTTPSLAAAEDFLARLWICLERYDVDMPNVQVRMGRGVTITAEFREPATAKLVIDELNATTL